MKKKKTLLRHCIIPNFVTPKFILDHSYPCYYGSRKLVCQSKKPKFGWPLDMTLASKGLIANFEWFVQKVCGYRDYSTLRDAAASDSGDYSYYEKPWRQAFVKAALIEIKKHNKRIRGARIAKALNVEMRKNAKKKATKKATRRAKVGRLVRVRRSRSRSR